MIHVSPLHRLSHSGELRVTFRYVVCVSVASGGECGLTEHHTALQHQYRSRSRRSGRSWLDSGLTITVAHVRGRSAWPVAVRRSARYHRSGRSAALWAAQAATVQRCSQLACSPCCAARAAMRVSYPGRRVHAAALCGRASRRRPLAHRAKLHPNLGRRGSPAALRRAEAAAHARAWHPPRSSAA